MKFPSMLAGWSRAGAETVRLVRGGVPYVYAGFVGAGNLGDEAMYEAIRDELALPEALTTRPGSATLPLRLARGSRRLSGVPLLLGGGTLIGRHGWLDRVELAYRATGEAPAISIGTGVEDPSFRNETPLTDDAELRRWIPILGRFRRVTVRGPRSAEILGWHGIGSEVVGDPALLASRGPAPEEVTEGEVAVNIGASGPIWGSQQELLAAMARYCKQLIRRGFRLRLVAMWHRDVGQTRELANSLGSSAVTVVLPRSPEELRSQLAKCQVLVGQRLHSVIVAASVMTPGIALAYRPKCEDFQASIGRLDFTMRTNEMDVALLLDLTQDAVDRRPVHVAALQGEVTRLRLGLSQTLAEIRSLVPSTYQGTRSRGQA